MASTYLYRTHVVVGAGFQGLPIVKKLRELGEDVLCLDRNADVGGIWHTGAYETAHIISSRRSTGFSDFPMPDTYPDFPSKAEMQRYFRSYAETFRLIDYIRLNTQVLRVRPIPERNDGARFLVETAEGLEIGARTVTLANGHHSEPVTATYPGHWSGQSLHASAYRSPQMFGERRVLVVGSGNTACDAAVDASHFGVASDISIRDGVYFFPRTFMGRPFDTLLRGLPFGIPWLERAMGWLVHKAAVGDPTLYGLPKPRFRVFDRHPVINSELLRRIRLGEIGVRPEIARFDGDQVTFRDGATARYDLLFWAIGYRITLPILHPADDLIEWRDGLPVLWLQLASPRRPGLFVAGLGQARTGGGPLFELGGYIIARMAAFDARSDKGVIQAVENTASLRFAKRWLGFSTVEKADTRSRSLHEHLGAGRQLNRLLDAIGAPNVRGEKGVSTAVSDLRLQAEPRQRIAA